MNEIKLFPHQEQALKKTEQFNRVAFYLDMGLGKTFLGSEKMFNLQAGCNLLICQKSKIDDWMEHFQTYYKVPIFDLTDKKQYQRFLELIELTSGVTGIINYELAFRRSQLLNLKDFTLMLDESSLIQNENAKRSKFILKMNPNNVILLSGTPTGGKYEKLWSQLHLLGWKISKKLYWSQYIDTEFLHVNGFPIKVIKGYKNVDRLKGKLKEHGAIFMKSEEVFNLPEQIENKIFVKSTLAYFTFMQHSIINFDLLNLCEFKDDSDFYGEDVTPRVELVGDTTLTKRLYARQLCGQYNKSKLQAFKDLVDSTEDRIIVFYNFNEELEKMLKLVEDKPISVVNGSVKDLAAYEKMDNSITFVQYQAGAKGLNLQKANKIIYFTLTQSCEDWMQSKKRIHRIGQKKTCFYYYLLCRNSVEIDILKALESGRDYTDELFKKYERC